MPRTVVLASMPLHGHVNPLRPIARALVERGHRVRWYAGRRFRESVEETGARFVPMSPAIDVDPEARERRPGRAGKTGLAAMRDDFKHSFLDPAPAQVAELRRLVYAEPVHAVVADFGFVGASLFHELTGVPWVSVGISPLTMPSVDTAPFGMALAPRRTRAGRLRNRALNVLFDRVLLRDVRAYNTDIRAQVGLPPLRMPLLGNISPLLHLQNGIADLEYPRSDLPPQVHFVGALADPPAAATDLPTWWADVVRSRVPVVHVTQGTVADADAGDLVLPAIRGLAGEDVLVVAGTGRADLGGDLPANVRTAPFVPHSWLLPQTAVMVSNGGFGAVQAALSSGVPLVLAGDSEDKPEVAARVAWAGAGVDLRTGRPSAEAVRAAVRGVLDDRRYAKRAAELREVYAARDAGQVAAELVERLIAHRLPVARV
jgi:UDP:flavonoid glycosyltransferase YjiC (YdhE family)